MYLSRIELDTRCYSTRRAIASPQILHAAVENCFSVVAGEKERKLWRLDNLRGKLYLLLLSQEKPDFTYFGRQFCAEDDHGETKDYNNLLKQIRAGQMWRFRLRGNATHSVSMNIGERGKIFAHVTVEHQCHWLLKKSQVCRFVLDDNMFEVTQTEQLRFRRNKNKELVTIGVAIFEGVLKVADAELFKLALTKGIGRAKAYGCGLLTIAGQL